MATLTLTIPASKTGGGNISVALASTDGPTSTTVKITNLSMGALNTKNLSSKIGKLTLSGQTLVRSDAEKSHDDYWLVAYDDFMNIAEQRRANGTAYTFNQSTSATTLTATLYIYGLKATGTITLPARRSYNVTYNANGGSRAPAAQKKYHGMALALSTGRPTREGYTFVGWATSATATSAAYQPGGTYNTDAALSLYAVWKVVVTGKLTARRKGDESTEGELTFTWSAKVAPALSYTVSPTGTSNGAMAAPSGTSGTSTGKVTGCSVDKTYTVILTATVAASSASGAARAASSYQFSAQITSAQYLLDFREGGKSMGIMAAAPATDGQIAVGGELDTIDRSVVVGDALMPASDGAVVSSDQYTKGFYMKDRNNALRGYMRNTALKDGRQGAQFEARRDVSGTMKYNGVSLLLDASGNPTVVFGSAAAWRTGLELDSLMWKNSQIPSLAAGKITSGAFAAARLTNAAKYVSGSATISVAASAAESKSVTIAVPNGYQMVGVVRLTTGANTLLPYAWSFNNSDKKATVSIWNRSSSAQSSKTLTIGVICTPA